MRTALGARKPWDGRRSQPPSREERRVMVWSFWVALAIIVRRVLAAGSVAEGCRRIGRKRTCSGSTYTRATPDEGPSETSDELAGRDVYSRNTVRQLGRPGLVGHAAEFVNSRTRKWVAVEAGPAQQYAGPPVAGTTAPAARGRIRAATTVSPRVLEKPDEENSTGRSGKGAGEAGPTRGPACEQHPSGRRRALPSARACNGLRLAGGTGSRCPRRASLREERSMVATPDPQGDHDLGTRRKRARVIEGRCAGQRRGGLGSCSQPRRGADGWWGWRSGRTTTC